MNKKISALFSAALISSSLITVNAVPAAEDTAYPSSFTEYNELLENCPELYRVDSDSVYFINPHISNTQLGLIVSSNQESSVDRNTYGCIFKPEEDGVYVVSVQEFSEEIVECGVAGHFHYFYPVLKNYTVEVTDGTINVELKGSKSWYSEQQVNMEAESLAACDVVGACFDVSATDSEDILETGYFSFVNGQLSDGENGYDSYITTVYDEYTTESYFCVNYTCADVGIDIEGNQPPRVTAEEQDISSLVTDMYTSSWCSGDLLEISCDIMEFSRIAAPEDGNLTIVVDGLDQVYYYPLTVENGIFHHAEEAIEPTTIPTTETIYESEGWLTLDTTPAQYYDVGCDIDLRGLAVTLEYGYGENGLDVIFDSVNPLDYPEAFIVDTSEYDSSTPGTYTIHISCTEEYRLRYRVVDYYTCFSVFVTEEIIEPADTCTVTIDKLPDKTLYTVGEQLDLTGAIVSADYRSTLTYDVLIESVPLTENLDKFNVESSDFDSTTPGTYTIYVTYQGQHTYDTASFEVTVTDKELIMGDCNLDGKFSIADVVMLQEWLLCGGDLTCRQNADLCVDNRIDIFDLCVMKQKLSRQGQTETEPMLLIMDDQIIESDTGWDSRTFVELIDSNGAVHVQESDMSSWDFDISYYLEEADTIIADIAPSYTIYGSDTAAIQAFIQNVSMYKDCEMTAWDFGIEDYGQENLYVVYQDESGAYQALELCRFGSECSWLENAEAQELVTMLIQNGYYAEISIFEDFLANNTI